MKKFIQFLSLLIVVFIVVGLILDNRYHIESSKSINASKSQIHSLVNDLNEWPKWSPWLEMDPTIKTELGEITSGIGAHQSWTSDKEDPGALTFIAASEESGITYDLFFGKPGEMDKSVVSMIYEQPDPNDPARVNVRWEMDGAVETVIIGPYIAIMLEYMIPSMFDRGLEKLKAEAEKLP